MPTAKLSALQVTHRGGQDTSATEELQTTHNQEQMAAERLAEQKRNSSSGSHSERSNEQQVDNLQTEEATDTSSTVQAAHVVRQATRGGGRATVTGEDFALTVRFRIPFLVGTGKRITSLP